MTEQARIAVRCPECGAPLPESAARSEVRCARCGTTSVPAPAAEKVVQTVVVERVVLRGDAVAPSSAICPRCQLDLVGTKVDDIIVLGCSGCRGVWLDNAGSTAVMERRRPDLEELTKKAESATGFDAPPRITGGQLLHCPVCSRDMRRVRVAFIDVDVCAAHGTWFDATELRHVSEVLHPASLHGADPRKPLTQEQIEAEEAVLRAAAAEPTDETMPRDYGIASTARDLLGALGKGVVIAAVVMAETERRR